MWIWIYLSGVVAVLIIWILLNYIEYRKKDRLKITSSEIVYGCLSMICSWVGIGVNIIGYIIWWALQNKTIFNFEKKGKEEKK